MSDDQLFREVRDFLGQYALSVGHLEILIFCYEGREKSWSIAELSQKMRTNLSLVQKQLNDLRDIVKDCGGGRYQFNLENVVILQKMELTATLYRTHKHAIISEIYSRSLGKIRSFADAFKISKDDKS